MKARNIVTGLMGLLLAPILLGACGEDRSKAYEPLTRTDNWIYDTMSVYYYWRDDMPARGDMNYFQAPATFFKKLLSSQDKFSYIDSLKPVTRAIYGTEYSYGMHFCLYTSPENSSEYIAHVLYVADDSPAEEAGIERGLWILDMNGEAITKSNYTRLLGGAEMKISYGYYNAEQNAIVVSNQTKTLPAARAIEDNPVHYYDCIEEGNHRVGYLVYNHFSAGTDNEAEKYNDLLRERFTWFASKEVNDFVLDLRYNNGGLLTCAQLLCAMLCPTSALGQPLGYLEYSAYQETDWSEFYLRQELIGSGANLNLNRLYVLTTTETASASEMVINCLRPYMDVVVIGENTVGKNVGSIAFDNEELQITMSPIVCKLYNAERRSDYSRGFTPDITVSEAEQLATFQPFGNPQETLLSLALQQILDGNESGSASADTRSLGLTPVYNSLSERATNGVLIR